MLWAIALLALLTLLRSGAGWVALVATRIDHCPQLGCDFIRHYLPQARELSAEAGKIVPGWLYPPLLAVLLQPLSLLTDAAALRLWMGLQLLGAACLVWQCRCVLRGAGRWTSWAGAVGLVVLSLPVAHALKWGQVSVVAGVAAVWALQRRTRLAALILGGLAAIKLYLAFYGAAAILCVAGRRSLHGQTAPAGRWRSLPSRRAFAVWFGASALVLGLVVPLAVLGPRSTAAFGQRLADAARYVHPERLAYLGGQSLDLACMRWFVNGAHGGRDADGSAPRLVALGSAASQPRGSLRSWLLLLPGLVVVLVSWRRAAGSTDAARTALILLALGLAVQPGWHHYFAFLPFAIATALASARPLAVGIGIAAFLVSAAPLLLLADVPGIYFATSAWGATTCAALAAWMALVVSRGETNGAAADGAAPRGTTRLAGLQRLKRRGATGRRPGR